MALTLNEATALRTAYYNALLAVAQGQSYTIGQRTLTRADLAEISKEFEKWDAYVEELKGGGPAGARVFRVVPRDT